MSVNALHVVLAIVPVIKSSKRCVATPDQIEGDLSSTTGIINIVSTCPRYNERAGTSTAQLDSVYDANNSEYYRVNKGYSGPGTCAGAITPDQIDSHNDR